MQPDPTDLIGKIELQVPLMGLYDAPDVNPFKPLVEPEPGKRACVFTFYRQWLAGKTLHITKDNFRCPGAGHWLFSVVTRPREDFVRFLCLSSSVGWTTRVSCISGSGGISGR